MGPDGKVLGKENADGEVINSKGKVVAIRDPKTGNLIDPVTKKVI